MTDQWLFKSETYDNCNCAINCGCQFNLPTTYGFCQSANIGQMIEGHFNGISLVGLKWAGLYKWPGEIAEGNGMALIVVDERADAAQRTALETILSGRACAPPATFSLSSPRPARSSARRVLSDRAGGGPRQPHRSAKNPGMLRSSGRPIDRFTGKTFDIALARKAGSIEFTYAELGLGTTRVAGEMEMAFEDTWALFVCIASIRTE